MAAVGQQPVAAPPQAQSPAAAEPTAGGASFGGRGAAGISDGAPVVDIYALIERLAVEMDKEFILDPRMRGLSGLSTAGDDADYNSLLAILRSNGYAAIEVGDQVRVVPEAIARSEPSRILNEDDGRVSDHAIVTRVIDLGDFAPAVEGAPAGTGAAGLVPALRPLMSTAIGNIVLIPGTNTIVIVDRYDNVRRITAIVDELRQ